MNNYLAKLKACRSRHKRQPQSETHPPLLLQLPVDVVYELVDRLQPADIISLSLTCVTLFNLFFQTHAASAAVPDAPHRRSFLSQLEKDFADQYYYCDECVQLHRFRRQTRPLPWRQPRWTIVSNGRHGPLMPPPRTHGPVSFHHARLAMNHQLYGPRAGLPLSTFDFRLDDDFVIPPWSQAVSARVIAGELVFRIRYTLAGEETQLLASLAKESGVWPSVCVHRGALGINVPGSHAILPFVAAERRHRGFCTSCLSDDATDVERCTV